MAKNLMNLSEEKLEGLMDEMEFEALSRKKAARNKDVKREAKRTRTSYIAASKKCKASSIDTEEEMASLDEEMCGNGRRRCR